MKAIVTIFHHRLIVPCAKKALAFKEFIEASELEDMSAPYEVGVFPAGKKTVVTVETLPPDLVIKRQQKPSARRK